MTIYFEACIVRITDAEPNLKKLIECGVQRTAHAVLKAISKGDENLEYGEVKIDGLKRAVESVLATIEKYVEKDSADHELLGSLQLDLLG